MLCVRVLCVCVCLCVHVHVWAAAVSAGYPALLFLLILSVLHRVSL